MDNKGRNIGLLFLILTLSLCSTGCTDQYEEPLLEASLDESWLHEERGVVETELETDYNGVSIHSIIYQTEGITQKVIQHITLDSNNADFQSHHTLRLRTLWGDAFVHRYDVTIHYGQVKSAILADCTQSNDDAQGAQIDFSTKSDVSVTVIGIIDLSRLGTGTAHKKISVYPWLENNNERINLRKGFEEHVYYLTKP